jgi:hypothetical protein
MGRRAAEVIGQRLGQFDAGARPHRHKIEIRRLAVEQHVAHHATHGVGLNAFACGDLSNPTEHRLIRFVLEAVRKVLRHAIV